MQRGRLPNLQQRSVVKTEDAQHRSFAAHIAIVNVLALIWLNLAAKTSRVGGGGGAKA